ncbi:MAG TPA: penicillin-binding protein 2 [Anaerolineales bacterium]|nr:penicillin-binding protein 2 [Anaerolineales bacterium]
MTPEPQARRRVQLVMGVFSLVSLGLLIQLIRVQFGPYAPVFAALDRGGRGLTEEVRPARGLIFDRDGVLLAGNATRYYLEVELRQLDGNEEIVAGVVSALLGVPADDVVAQLTARDKFVGALRIRLTRPDEEGGRWPITVDPTAAGVISAFLADPEAPDLAGLALVPLSQRVYPAGSLAGHVLGFVNQEGRGYFGVEGFYDDWLTGRAVTVQRSIIPPEAGLNQEPPAGVNLVLTIDADIQQMVEGVLQRTIEWSEAAGGQIIVMDPSNGEILALAAWPTLDPNAYGPWLGDQSEEEPVINPAVGGQYEPGSTFKVLVMAAALDAGVVLPDDVFVDTGEIEVGGHTIRNWDGEAWGPQTMVGCLEHSLNVCLAFVASQRLGAETLYDYLARFGVGRLTGVDLAGEVPGQLRTPTHPEWTESDLGTNAFGQGVSVTPIQLLAAVSAIANGGDMVQPHVVRQVVSSEGAYWPSPTTLGRPISARTSQTLTDMLIESLEDEALLIDLAGYRFAGKTGTAQIPSDYGYDPNLTVASFIGWGPMPGPRFLVLVRIDRPRISPWGSVVAAPAFQDVAERLVVLMGIPPDSERIALVGRE